MSDCLILDSSGWPMEVRPWQDAIGLTLDDKGFTLDEDTEKILHSANFECAMPRVVMLKNFVAVKLRTQIPFSRRNIAIRDDSRCQYCGLVLSSREYTMDHVIPRSKGGLSTWTNLVLACGRCNKSKANMTLEESGMKLLRGMPKQPKAHDNRFNFRLNIRDIRPEWKVYLGWDSEDASTAYWNAELEK